MANSYHKSALPSGYQLDCYELESVIGAGGFGITYKARDTTLGHYVAIKEFFPAYLVNRSDSQNIVANTASDQVDYELGLKKYIDEGKILATFRHPNIVRVLRHFEANGTAYLVMDYEKGASLSQYLKAKPFPPQAQVEEILNQVLDGLEEIHSHHYLHRDIKPSNIYLRENFEPVLIDFGSARNYSESQSIPLTNIVSEGFAPIEQYPGRTKQTSATDIYALGATLYYIITGMPPISSIERFQGVQLDNRDALISATIVANKKYDEKLQDLTDWMLELTPDKRPQNVQEVRDYLASDMTTMYADSDSTGPGTSAKSITPDRSATGSSARIRPRPSTQPAATPANTGTTVAGAESARKKILRRVALPFALLLIAVVAAAVWLYESPMQTHPDVLVYSSQDPDANGRVTIVPYDKTHGLYLLEMDIKDSRYSNKALMYRMSTGRLETRFVVVWTAIATFVTRSRKSGPVLSYPLVRQGTNKIKMKLVGAGPASEILRLKNKYHASEFIYESEKRIMQSNKAALARTNSVCQSNISVNVDWKSLRKQKLVAMVGTTRSYLDAMTRLCKSDKDYREAIRKLTRVSVVHGKLKTHPSPNHVIFSLKKAGNELRIHLHHHMANLSMSAYSELKEIL